MAAVTGPTSALPGALRSCPEGQKCDDHPTILAVIRVTGEVDSFGSEQYDMCQECYDKFKEECKIPITAKCDWCGTPDVVVTPMRDYEEGMSGRVYEVCRPCKEKYNKRVAEELAELDDYSRYNPDGEPYDDSSEDTIGYEEDEDVDWEE